MLYESEIGNFFFCAFLVDASCVFWVIGQHSFHVIKSRWIPAAAVCDQPSRLSDF